MSDVARPCGAGAHRAARRSHRRKRRWACVCAALFAALGLSALLPPRPRLLWNSSASAPIGLWRIVPDGAIARGDMVVTRLADPWRSCAAERGYLPANVPLIKRVAAEPGDKVCATGSEIFVNGKRAAVRRDADGSGRAMPRWRGCTTLTDGATLLLMDDPQSFDGRYFGPTARRDIIGRAHPLWLR